MFAPQPAQMERILARARGLGIAEFSLVTQAPEFPFAAPPGAPSCRPIAVGEPIPLGRGLELRRYRCGG